jgi:hypothetical protein
MIQQFGIPIIVFGNLGALFTAFGARYRYLVARHHEEEEVRQTCLPCVPDQSRMPPAAHLESGACFQVQEARAIIMATWL